MLFPVKRLRGMFFILLLVLAQGSFSAAEERAKVEIEPARDELERWVPALSVSLGMLLQRGSAASESSDILEPDPLPFGTSKPAIRPPASGKNLMFAPIAHASIELMTPGLLYVPFVTDIAIPGRPRLFMHGDVAASFSQKYDHAKEGEVGEFDVPNLANPSETDILGQGSRGQAYVDTLVWSAGGGLALTFDVFDRRIRIKPSVEWIREKIVVIGDVRRLVKLVNPLPIPKLDGFRQIILAGHGTKVLNGIGPGLEIEVDSKRAGPFVVSTFMGARVYRMLGNMDIDVKATSEYDETFEVHYTNARWSYQGFFGIRIRLIPE